MVITKEKRADIVMQLMKKHTYTLLDWDTNHFGIISAKLSLHQPISSNDFKSLIRQQNDVEFLTIVNENSNPENSRVIGEETKAYLVDVNIQFQKKISKQILDEDVIIQNNFNPNERLLDIASFQISRFIEDRNLSSRGGNQVYKEWLRNSFNSIDKYFAISQDFYDEINGFILFSLDDDKCVIELISVDLSLGVKGIGTKLFKAVEAYAYSKGIKVIQVGTQVRNQIAINFYHKLGCKQIGCHQVYHMWKNNFRSDSH